MYGEICSRKNIFRAWHEFKQGKIRKQEVADFSVRLEEHLFQLSVDLCTEKYVHGTYQEFYVCDPKRRHIHKASVIDRLAHHAIFRIIAPLYEKKFIFDSYSSRPKKGTHRACERFQGFSWKLSRNNTRTVWVLKCDIRKFFDSVDHTILLRILQKTIDDEKTYTLLQKIIGSFDVGGGKGIPLGNLTSQLFSNVYLDYFDQYVKRVLRVKYYIRYADDLVILDTDRNELKEILPQLATFLEKELSLSLHPHKVYIRKFSQGIDFLGYVIFPHFRVLRTKTKQRMLKKIKFLKHRLDKQEISQEFFDQSMASYYSVLKHCHGNRIKKTIDSMLEAP